MKNEVMIQDIRRLALVIWLCSMGGVQNVIMSKKLGQNAKARISHFLQGYSFGAQAARHLEQNTGIPAKLLDVIPEGYESVLRKLVRSDAHSSFYKYIGDDPALDIDMVKLESIDFCLRGIPPLRVSAQWLQKNISNSDAIKAFIIVEDIVQVRITES